MTTQYGNNIDSTTSGTAGEQGVSTSGGVHEKHSTGGGIKSAVAGIHGIGEKIRGEFNGSVDRAAGDDPSKSVKTAASGERELETGKFSAGTKEREGLFNKDRHAQANKDLNREEI